MGKGSNPGSMASPVLVASQGWKLARLGIWVAVFDIVCIFLVELG